MINLNQQNSRAGRGVCVFIHELKDFKKRKDLSISNNDSEILSTKITNKTKKIILNSVYTPPDYSLKKFKKLFKTNF